MRLDSAGAGRTITPEPEAAQSRRRRRVGAGKQTRLQSEVASFENGARPSRQLTRGTCRLAADANATVPAKLRGHRGVEPTNPVYPTSASRANPWARVRSQKAAAALIQVEAIECRGATDAAHRHSSEGAARI